MKKYPRLISIFLILLILAFTPASIAMYDRADDFYSENIYMENLETGRVIIDIDSREKVYPASLTKILTCLITIEHFSNLDETYEIPQGIFDDIYEQGGANISLKAGEIISVRDLLHATLIRSACDSATALACCVSGSVEEFAKEMNRKASELGATDSHFVNAHGLHDENHYSTAQDLAIIAKFALQNETFCDIISKWNYTIPATNKSAERYFETTMDIENPTSDSYYAYCTGVKSGFTDEAGRCLITLSQKGNESYLLVTLGANKDKYYLSNMAYTDAVNLHEYAFAKFSLKSLVSPSVPLTEIAVENGAVSQVQICSSEELTYLCAIDEEIKIAYNIPESVKAPVTAGTELGTVSVSVSDKDFVLPLYAVSSVEAKKTSSVISDNPFLSFLNITTIAVYVLTALVLVFFCIIFFKKKSKKH